MEKDNKVKEFFSKIWDSIKSAFVAPEGEEPGLVKFNKKESTKKLYASLICVLVGMIAGIAVMVILILSSEEGVLPKGDRILNGIKYIFGGPFSSTNEATNLANTGNMIFYTSSLILTGISVGIAYKTGLFNIGAPGQFLMGTTASLLVALSIQTENAGWAVWMLACVVGIAAGALWGAIPGLFKALFGTNEVIVCIMTNWIAANLSSWIFSALPSMVNIAEKKSGYILNPRIYGNATPTLGLENLFPGSLIDISIVIVIIIAIVMQIIMNRTTFGYELKACGANRNASQYAGMDAKRNIILSMVIAGALAGLGGAFYYLNAGTEFNWSAAYSQLPDYGFDGIPAALLGCCSPVGIIFGALFIKYIAQGGTKLQGIKVGLNRYISSIIIAIIIYLAGFLNLFISIISKIQKNSDKKKKEKVEQKVIIKEEVKE